MNIFQKTTAMKALLQHVINHISHPTAIACRAFLVLAMIVGWGTNAVGQETILYSSDLMLNGVIMRL